ncbi:ERF family protein [Zhongshania sp.]|uniref:ERF family protein n=1 Tax=Zhongshania sp. TaxID=1971902 RepID=UPI00356221FB
MEQQTTEHEADATVEPAQKLEIAERGEVTHSPKGPLMQIEPAQVVNMIERIAVDPNANPERMHQMLDFLERLNSKDAKQRFSAAMATCQADMSPVATDATNNQTRSKYATYAALDRALRPIYTQHGFSLSFDTADSPLEQHVRVVCYVEHLSGHSRTHHIDIPADGKGAKGGDVMTKTHATGSATSYGMRYLLKMIFNVAVGEADDDGNAAGKKPSANNNPTLTTTQLSALRNALKAQGDRAEGAFCKAWSVFQLEDLWQSNFDAAMQQVLRRAERLKAKTQQ